MCEITAFVLQVTFRRSVLSSEYKIVNAAKSPQHTDQARRHIANVHKLDPSKINQIITCVRCKEMFTTSQQHEAHIRVPLEHMCPVRDLTDNLVDTPDPEDGISPQVDSKLRDRRSEKSVTTWDSLWRTLFPGDEDPKPEGKQSRAAMPVRIESYPDYSL